MKKLEKLRPIHPFPARMAPGIAFDVLAEAKKPLRVLDPMMGSGTVLAVARSKGHRAIGIDIDPLAVLISKVWTTSVDPDAVQDKAVDVLDRAVDIFARLPTRNAYPRGADQLTRQFITYWFDDYARRQLTSLVMAIERVKDDTVRNLLWCAFSRLIITKQSGASLAMDLSHSRPHKSFARAPAKPFRNFLGMVNRVVPNCIDKNSKNRGPATQTYEGDARALPLESHSVDLVLTSPPYLNALDYIRCSKFTLVWMGYRIEELRRLRSQSVGTESCRAKIADDKDIAHLITDLKLRPALGTKDKRPLARYIYDMRLAVHEVSRVLKPGGRAIYVIGENTIKGTYIRNSHIVSAVAELAGLSLIERRVRRLPANRRYLPPPTSRHSVAALDARMRSEVILSFKGVVP